MKRVGFTEDKPFHEQFKDKIFEKYGIILE